MLTTILGIHDGLAIPCAYLLSNSKETHNYQMFYSVCVIKTCYLIHSFIYLFYPWQTIKESAKGEMSPKGVLLDFEEALLKDSPGCSPGQT